MRLVYQYSWERLGPQARLDFQMSVSWVLYTTSKVVVKPSVNQNVEEQWNFR